jgi:hypothetical protein
MDHKYDKQTPASTTRVGGEQVQIMARDTLWPSNVSHVPQDRQHHVTMRKFPDPIIPGDQLKHVMQMAHTTLGFWGYWIVQLSNRAHNNNYKHDSAALRGRNYPGKEISASLEALQLERGCAGNPLEEDNNKFHYLATQTWVKSFWGRLHHIQFVMHLEYKRLNLPRQNDALLVEMFLRAGFKKQPLQTLDQCKLFINLFSCWI